ARSNSCRARCSQASSAEAAGVQVPPLLSSSRDSSRRTSSSSSTIRALNFMASILALHGCNPNVLPDRPPRQYPCNPTPCANVAKEKSTCAQRAMPQRQSTNLVTRLGIAAVQEEARNASIAALGQRRPSCQRLPLACGLSDDQPAGQGRNAQNGRKIRRSILD